MYLAYSINQEIKPILSQHKEWLQNFQKHAQEKKTALHYSQVQSRLHPDRYRSNSDKQTQQREQKAQQITQPQHEATKVEESQQEQQYQHENNNALGDEIIDDQELNELLDFTKNLDFEQYINDLEVKTVVEALKKRIEEIRIENPQLSQKEATKKALKQNNNATQKQSKKHVTIQEEQLQKNTEKKEVNLENIAKKIAEEILQKNKYLRNIHSNISMQKLVETEARRFLQKE
ncbi:unnamed protein product (macronuclear) [Paramecium tetraurelia]|uniref:Uncharacterized protein n=1 Tax=Paramecium tetraurelia TaxID=5888 RepID=A0CUM0_PARTE|nr:uncharacterized protein GSPATT00010687001 [Paramecium tetraurelia]CAK74487.1 unnamed protein product [Paramecium tetraurelia]|eukprot:XP_001441884.1 hypothetical protein (macronuclear) [Paramecium tetraurelia strain d4-2]